MKKAIYSLIIAGLLASCGGKNNTSKERVSGEEYKTIDGVDFPLTLKHDSTELVLNGVGVRTFLFVKVYVGGLYIHKKNYDAEVIIAEDEPAIIRLHAVSRAFTSERMAKTVREQFKKSNADQFEALRPRIDILCNRLAQETIEVGDECDLWYTPNEGLRFLKNGKDINILIPGLDFKQALFRNFISDIPADEALKKGFLGL